MKKIFLFAAAAAALFTSCLMSETGGEKIEPVAGERTELSQLNIKIVDRESSATRAQTGAAALNGTSLKDGYIFFIDPDDGDALVDLIEIDTDVASDLTGDAGYSYTAGVRVEWEVFVVGNIPSDDATDWSALADLDAIKAAAMNISSQTAYADAALVSVDPDTEAVSTIDLGVIERPNGDDEQGVATIKITLKPVVSRLEVASIKAKAAGNIASFDVTGVFLDNYNDKFNYAGGIGSSTSLTTLIATGGSENLPDATAYGADVATWTAATVSGAMTAIPSDGDAATTTDVWAYNVVSGNVPRILVELSNIVMKAGSGMVATGKQYIRVVGYDELDEDGGDTFEPGMIYRVAAIEFDEYDLQLAPINNNVGLTVDVEVGAWGEPVETDVDIVGDGYTVKTASSPAALGSTVTKSPDIVPVPEVAGGVTVTLTAAASKANPSDGNKVYYFQNWTLPNDVTLTSGTANTPVITFTQPAHSNWTFTANYVDIVQNPVGEATFVLAGNNSVTWAKTDLSAAGTFALTAETVGANFTWNQATNPTANSLAATGTDGSICPVGWRMPTAVEWANMINIDITAPPASDTNGTLTGSYSTNVRSGNITMTSVVDPTQSILLSGTTVYYWSGTEGDASGAWRMYFNNTCTTGRMSNSSKTSNYRVRCVR